MTEESKLETGRRKFMGAVGGLAAVSLLGSTKAQGAAQTTPATNAAAPATGRRR